MITIYGVQVLRVKGEERPVLRHAEAKETKKFYMVEGGVHGFLGYRGRIEKTEEKYLSFSPRHAWERYIQRCNRMRIELRAEEAAMSRFQRHAISELADLSEGEA